MTDYVYTNQTVEIDTSFYFRLLDYYKNNPLDKKYLKSIINLLKIKNEIEN